MKTKYTLIAAAFIILMIVLSELNNSRTKQQLENIKYEAEERLMSPSEWSETIKVEITSVSFEE